MSETPLTRFAIAKSRLNEVHWPNVHTGKFGQVEVERECSGCGDDWPCDTAVLILDAQPDTRLREAVMRMLDEPTTDFHTSASRALFEKAKRSSTQEVTITAQALRMVLPAIEGEAITQAIRAALGDTQPADPEPIVNETESGYARRRELVDAARSTDAYRADLAAKVRALPDGCAGSFATGHAQDCPFPAVLALIEGEPQ